jgi:DNA-binding transcriptional LysR family regulator
MASKLDLYKVFCIVAKHGSISRAAEELFMSQSAVSQAVMQLERDLDTRLFRRMPKGVALTDEGILLHEHVRSALHLIEAGKQKLLELKNVAIGELKIGVGDTISRYFLLPYLEAFRKLYPNIKFKIFNGTTMDICAMLKEGKAHIGLCNFPIEDPSLEQIDCLEVQDIFVCGEAYRSLLEDPVSLADIAKHPLILLEPNSNSRRFVEAFMLSRGIPISPEFELGSHELLLDFARSNMGIACVTKPFAQEYLDNRLVHEIPVTPAIPKRTIGVCYLKGVPLSPAANRFVEQLVGQARMEP